MSILFTVNNDSFLRWALPEVAAGSELPRMPMTFAIWVKFPAGAPNNQNIMTVGRGRTNNFQLLNRSSHRCELMIDATVDGGVFSGVDTWAGETWYFLAGRLTDESTYDIYISEYQGTPDKQSGATTFTNWTFGDWIHGVCFGSYNVDLVNSQPQANNIKVAYGAAWDRVLSDLELDSLKDGALPTTIPTNLMGAWIEDGGDLVTSLDDVSGNAGPLVIYGASDNLPNSGAYPPVYDADNPPLVPAPPTNKLRVPLVYNTTGLSFSNQSGIQYELTEGADSENQVAVDSGSGLSTGNDGVITLDIAGHNVGDIVQARFWQPVTGINVQDTLIAAGPVVVST